MQVPVSDTHAVATDGTILRGSYSHDLGADNQPQQQAAQQQLSAVDIASGVVGQRCYSGDKNEAYRVALWQLVRRLIAGAVVLVDALHTSRQTAALLGPPDLYFIVQVQANQPVPLAQRSEYCVYTRC